MYPVSIDHGYRTLGLTNGVTYDSPAGVCYRRERIVFIVRVKHRVGNASDSAPLGADIAVRVIAPRSLARAIGHPCQTTEPVGDCQAVEACLVVGVRHRRRRVAVGHSR